MTGLRVWLHPSSRTKSAFSIACHSEQSEESRFLRTQTRAQIPALLGMTNERTDPLHSAPLRRTAAVVRDRGRVADGADFDSRGRQRADCGFASGTGAADAHVHAADAVIARHVGGVRGGLLGGKGRALARSTEAERARTLPRQNVAVHVGDGHDRVIERGLHMHQSVRYVLALLLFEGLLLAFFIRCGCAARCCWFCHRTSSFKVSRFQSFKVFETLKPAKL